jgi:DNA-3-methyladenine glycosylase I
MASPESNKASTPLSGSGTLSSNTPINNDVPDYRTAPAQTPQSQNMSKTLKKQGFKFVGPTTCYAFMQAVGMVNDHENSCHFK